MSYRNRRVPAPAAFVLVASLTGIWAGTSHAFTLERLASMVDVGKFASAVPVAQFSGLSGTLLLEPLNADLAGPTTEFRVRVASETIVRVEVTNEAGECVCSARIAMPAGTQKVGFSGRDASGKMLPNGSYLYTVIAGDAIQTAHVTISR